MTPIENGSVTSPLGYRAAGVIAGLKRSGNADMALVVSDTPAAIAGAFTANLFAAPPVQYCRELLTRRKVGRAVIINSGNANACTGRQGLRDASSMAARVAARLELDADDVLVCSTGRIGVPMPMQKVHAGIDSAAAALKADGGNAAARAIMTTDTVPKSVAVKLHVGGVDITIGGMAKGAGMIAPRLIGAPPHATLLSVITTDAAVDEGFLHACLVGSLDASFNRISIDGDMSTNDSFLALANGRAGNAPLRKNTLEGERFAEAFAHVAGELARQLVWDGEGATRFVELHVSGARSVDEARTCGMAIANSLLCKTAWFGADPNWGRILDAAGYSGVSLVPDQVRLDYDGLPIVRAGVDAGTTEADAAKAINKRQFRIDLNLGAGTAEYTVWTCDVSYDYVKINADYHT